MSDINTAAIVAHDALPGYIDDSNTDDGFDRDDMRAFAQIAIEEDRKRRGLVEAVAEVLDDRDADAAAQLVRDTDPDDDLWKNYFGPMLDELEADYTASARQIDEG